MTVACGVCLTLALGALTAQAQNLRLVVDPYSARELVDSGLGVDDDGSKSITLSRQRLADLGKVFPST